MINYKYRKLLIISDNIELCFEFKKIISNFKNVSCDFGISKQSSIQTFKKKLCVNVSKIDLADIEQVKKIIKKFDLVISLHSKQIFPKKLLKSVKCINIHPGYNPINRGWYPHIFAIINDLPVGATIHEIDEKIDNGRIIDRVIVKKYDSDTSKDLYKRIKLAEIKLLKNNLDSILKNSYKTILPELKGNLFYKKDFLEICELDLNKKMRLKDALKILRALTHGDYNNAYYFNEEGKKFYVKIKISKE